LKRRKFTIPPLPPNRGSYVVKPQPHPSPKEAEVLQLLLFGLERREIARELGVNDYTIRRRIQRLRKKLDRHDHIDLVLRALELGWLDTTSMLR
jgi:DNA-binding NarL/FixJ family response regulator